MPVSISGSGPITGVTSINTTVSDTELGYLDGVTSALQTQINTAGGLVLVAAQSFSAASTVSVNNCFSATYDNYRVLVLINAGGSGTVNLQGRLRAAGTDATGSNYDFEFTYGYGATVGAEGLTAQTAWNIGSFLASARAIFTLDVFSPFASATTLAAGQSTANHGSVGFLNRNTALQHTATTSYDGLTIYPSSSTITGTFRVYGYRNSL